MRPAVIGTAFKPPCPSSPITSQPHHIVPPSPTLRALVPDEWSTYRTLRLAALRDAPDAFGSTLAAEQERLPEQWRDRLAQAQTSGADLPLVAAVQGQALGLLWAKVDADDARLVHLFQMWVVPEARGQGLGKALLAHAIAWARSVGARCVQLGVTSGDTPAARLYASAGFHAVGPEVALREGSALRSRDMRLVLGDGAGCPRSEA